MCRLDESWHVPCGHWGPRRNVSPCANGQVGQIIRIKGCIHSTTEGCSRVNTLCPSCKYLRKREGKTTPDDTSPQSEQSEHSQKSQNSRNNSRSGMTVHGLSGEDGKKWLRHRLRRWRARKLSLGEKFEESNRSQTSKERRASRETSEVMKSKPSEITSAEPSGFKSSELSDMINQIQM